MARHEQVRDVALIHGAFEEVLRLGAPVRTFFRTTTKAVDVGGGPRGRWRESAVCRRRQLQSAPLGQA
jgi:hypothetical protein